MLATCPVLSECARASAPAQLLRPCSQTEVGKYALCVLHVGVAYGPYLVCQGLNECLQAIEAVGSPFQGIL